MPSDAPPQRHTPRSWHAPGGPGDSGLGAGLVATALLVLALAILMSVDPRSGWSQKAGDLAILAASATATAACLLAARRGVRARLAWAFMAAATGLWTAGMAYWTWMGLTRDHRYAFPSFADVGFVGYAVPAAVALLLFPRNSRGPWSPLRVALDGLLIACGVLFVSWATVLGPLYRSDAAGAAYWVALAFPTADVLIVSLVLVLGLRAGPGARLPWFLMGGGWLVLSLTDSAYVLLLSAGETGLTGTPLTAGWVAAFLLLALATRAPVRPVAPKSPPSFTVAQELLPYLPVLAAVLVVSLLHPLDSGEPFLVVVGAVLLIVVVLHQAVLMVEKVTVANGLEQAVAARTAQLAEALHRSDLILNSAGDGIYGVDAQGRITFANAATGQLTGYRTDELIGQDSHALLHQPEPEGHSADCCPVTVAVRTGAPQHLALDGIRRKDGTFVEVEKLASPITADGTVNGAVVTFRDITRRRQLERMKDDFTSIVSHELRTPLTSIRASVEMLAGGELGVVPPQAQRMLNIALGNTERLTRLINDILDMERIQAGRLELQPRMVPAQELMEAARDALEAMAGQAGVSVTLTPCDAPVWADPDRATQAFTNVLSNAIKFSPPGGAVRLGAERSDHEVVFSVVDEGHGIPAEHLELVFTPFHQVDSSDSGAKGGSGLGLPISRRIIEQHGGAMWVRSEPGSGTSFFFGLPVQAPSHREPPTPPSGGARAVVLCHLDGPTSERLSTALARHGFRAVSAVSGEHAVVVARRVGAVAVVVGDERGGARAEETAARLRGKVELAGTPVLAWAATQREGEARGAVIEAAVSPTAASSGESSADDRLVAALRAASDGRSG